jgi:hypothetical protein
MEGGRERGREGGTAERTVDEGAFFVFEQFV